MEAVLTNLPSETLRIADLATRKPTQFDLSPSADDRAAIARALDIVTIKKLRFTGQIAPLGRNDWELTAQMGATVVQSCVVTLDPVTTRLDESIVRRYLANFDEPSEEEVEMTADENAEDLPATLDLIHVLTESLSLALPPYPRQDGAELGDAVFTQPGAAPMTDEAARPFAGLAGLRDSLENKGSDKD